MMGIGYPKDWNDDEADEYLSSDLLVLGEDGEQATFIPLTGPVKRREKAFGTERERMHVAVARCGDDAIETSDTWYIQDWPVGKRLFRRYRALRRKELDGFEGRVILRLVRQGESGDQETKYFLHIVGRVTPEAEAAVDALRDDALAE